MRSTGQLNQRWIASGSDRFKVSALARPLWRTIVLLCLSCALNVPHLDAETMEEQIQAMRLEIERLHQEVDALREEVRHAHGTTAVAGTAQTGAELAEGQFKPPNSSSSPTQEEESPSPAEVIPLLQSQIAEQAQTKVESNSRLPVKFFGTVESNAFFNTGEANWVDLPNLVGPPPNPAFSGGESNFSLRQSRLGAIVQGLSVGSLKATGFLGLDFYGGTPAGQPVGIPRILYAYIRLEGRNTALEVGEDEMILAPRNPTSLAALAVPELFRSGNLYLRVPQVRVEHSFAIGERSELLAVGGILAPVGGYGTYSSTFPLGRARYPAAQARLAWQAKPNQPGEEPTWAVGFSGHYGRERMNILPLESWASAVDFDLWAGRLGFGGEGYVGRNMGPLGGGLGQSGKAVGGYMEGRLKATRRLQFNAGFGTDQLYDRVAFPAPLAKNQGLFANTIYQFTPELQTSFEYRWLATTPDQGAVRRNNHFDLAFAYSF